jgi:phytanoyl-CoA hydroxylase
MQLTTKSSEPLSNSVRFHSRFGGLWIDRSDWQVELDARLREGRIGPATGELIPEFVRNGFVILRRAAEAVAIDAFQDKIARSFREGNEHLLYQLPGVQRPSPVSAGLERRGTRIVDAFAVMPEARRLFASPSLMAFLAAIFDEDPLLFQSLSFDQGSEQGLHQDTAYVVVDRPLEFAACWIALEDVKPGAGELIYVPGSHRFDDFDFNGKKHWSPDEDGNDKHQEWARWLHAETERRGLSVERFLARRGDVLIWHADLAHGGSPIADPTLTRQSLVGHFCPAARRPHYFSYAPQRAVVRSQERMHYSSFYYDLSVG